MTSASGIGRCDGGGPGPDGGEPETVFISGRSGGGEPRRAHTDRDCPNLKKARTVFERRRDVYPGDLNYCKTCTGEIDRTGPRDRSYIKALKEAANNRDGGDR